MKIEKEVGQRLKMVKLKYFNQLESSTVWAQSLATPESITTL